MADSNPRASSSGLLPGDADPYAVLESAPNAIVAVDQDGRIRYANPQLTTTFGYAVDEVLGQPVEMLMSAAAASRHIGHRATFRAHPAPRPLGIGLDLGARRKDGTEFPVEISLTPVQTSQGLITFATLVDISARFAANAALAASERRFRVVLEASPNAIIAIGTDGRISYANPRLEATFGYTSAEVIGQPVEMLLPERAVERHVVHRDGFLAHPAARPMGIGLDLAGRRKDGSEFPVEISLSPVETSEGPQAFATVVDITARKSAENQLLQAQKLESIGRLAGGIAHDFNNMLFAIRGYAEIVTEDLAPERRAGLDPDTLLPSVAAIYSAAEKASVLTSQLLAFSRQQVVTPKVVNVNAGVAEVEPMLRRLIGENLRLVLRLHPEAGNVRADPGQLDQILVNLVVNARDAMPDGGTLTIETGNVVFDEPYAMQHFEVTPGPYVLLAVSDTGVGMDRETREHIFEPFFTTKDVGKGTGLGLATTYGIVRQAGGHIWLYSEPGIGSTFKLYFPQVDALAAAADAQPEAATAAHVGLVMVVEDEPAVREMTTMLLRRAGFTVIPVEDGAAAVALLSTLTEPIDVLVTDVIMPNMSGLDLAEQVMNDYPKVGVVLLSGYTAETLDLDRIAGRGAIFVPKPITAAGLLQAVRQAGHLEAAGR